jgi:isoleucyl-tRNA synthetase
VAKNRIVAIQKVFQTTNAKIISEFGGLEISGITYKHPYLGRTGLVIEDEYVSDEDGTGLVHNAPDFGIEDFLACEKVKIKPFNPMDGNGVFNQNCLDQELVGKFYLDTNEIVIKKLEDAHSLIKYEPFNHQVAHD